MKWGGRATRGSPAPNHQENPSETALRTAQLAQPRHGRRLPHPSSLHIYIKKISVSARFLANPALVLHILADFKHPKTLIQPPQYLSISSYLLPINSTSYKHRHTPIYTHQTSSHLFSPNLSILSTTIHNFNSMAPKRARRSESSSAQSGSTDSSSMGFGVINITTPEAQAEFTRLMGKPIAKERGFLPSPGDGKLVQMI